MAKIVRTVLAAPKCAAVENRTSGHYEEGRLTIFPSATRHCLPRTRCCVGRTLGLLFVAAWQQAVGAVALAQTSQPQRAAPQIEPPSQDAQALPDGWRRSFPIGVAQLGEGHTYHVWVEDGWLHVSRKTASQQPDWHIVLARVVNGEKPGITRRDDSIFFSLSYRKGRYFVREDINNLLCVRERKTNQDGTLSLSRLVSDSAESRGSCGSAKSTPVLCGWIRRATL